MQPSLTQLAESWLGGARERSVTLACISLSPSPSSAPSVFCRQLSCQCCLSCLDLPK